MQFNGMFPQLDSGVWLELPMLRCKRRLVSRSHAEPPLFKKKCGMSLKTLLDRNEPSRPRRRAGCLHSHQPEACLERKTKRPTDTKLFSEQILPWASTQDSVNKVLNHFKFKQASDDIFLDNSINKKFLEFHRDITEECGAEDKQHSWAVIEKQEEVVMYGPYYPNYKNGKHSEDIIIKQTQELLESDTISEDWKVYVFTTNSPCLSRNTEPCMLSLLQKAEEWWTKYGVKTHIGFVKCWGFKGNKETLFRDINYNQVVCINQTDDHDSYIKATENSTNLTPVCETLFSAVKHLLRSEDFSLSNIIQGQDWKGYFKSIQSISPENTKEVNNMMEAAQTLLSGTSGNFEESLEKGQEFVTCYTFSSLISDAISDQIKLTFEQSWKEMVQDKYAEAIRERLTEDFNKSTIQLFIKEVIKVTKQYLNIGRLQFLEEVKPI